MPDGDRDPGAGTARVLGVPELLLSDNLLLANLGELTLQRFGKKVHTVTLKSKQVIHRANATLRYAYFPRAGMISLVVAANGKSVEIAVIGAEGFFGLPLLFRTSSCPMTAVSQVGGDAFKLKAEDFQEMVRTDECFADAVHHYAHAQSIMVAQGAVCHSAHKIEQRCAKWLLMAQDRLGGNQFPLTQEFLAQMLGVRRSTVSEVAAELQKQKLISYRQGRMQILSRQGLEETSCSCYVSVRMEFERVGVALTKTLPHQSRIRR